MTDEQYPKIFLYRRLVQAKLFIDHHYAEKIDVCGIAEEAHLSRFHFIRQFKAIYRQTPHQYLIAVRIARAKELLRTGMPVTEACFAVGFESVSSFSSLFKRIEGVNPSAFLRQQLVLKEQVKTSPLRFIPGCFAEKSGWL